MISLALANLDPPWEAIALIIAILVISLGIHEAAHGWTALKCGDPTARDLGRITLNPVAHIDPVMTIILPLFLYLGSGGQMIFGGAKPVPVSFHGLRRPYRDMALVAIAGPLSNFLIAAVLLVLLKLAVEVLGIWATDGRFLYLTSQDTLGTYILEYGIYLNLLLAAFNLVPVPPLDGSRVLTWLLPPPLRETDAGMERYGMLLIFALFFVVPGFRSLLFGMIFTLLDLLNALVTLGGLW